MQDDLEARAVRSEHDTPLGRFMIAWGMSGDMEQFAPPAPADKPHDLYAMDPAGARTIDVVYPRDRQITSLPLYRSRTRPDGLYALAEITNGVWAQGTRIALPYRGPADRVRDAWIIGRPASSYDAQDWETLAVEPYLLTLARRGDEHGFEVHAESGFGFREALYPLDPSQADGLGRDRHIRILLAAALHRDVQNDAAPDVADFAALCDLVLAGPSAALSARLEAARDVRVMLRHAYGLPPGGDAFARDWFERPDGPPEGLDVEALDVTAPEFGERSPWARDEVVHNADGSRFAAAINVHEHTMMNELGRLVWGIVRQGRPTIIGRGDSLRAVCGSRPFAHWVTDRAFVVRVAARDGRRPLLAVDIARGFATLTAPDDGKTLPADIVPADLEGLEWSPHLARLKPVVQSSRPEPNSRSEPKPPAGVSRLLGELWDIVRALEPLTLRLKPRAPRTGTARTRRAVGEEIGLDRDFERLEPALVAVGAERGIVWRDPRGPDGFVTREYGWRGRLIRVDHTFEGRFAVKVSAEPASSERPPGSDGWVRLEALVEPDAYPDRPGALPEETDADTFLRRIAKLPEALAGPTSRRSP